MLVRGISPGRERAAKLNREIKKNSHTVPAESRPVNPRWAWLGLVVLLGFVLRVIRLGAPPYWNDEVYSVLLTRDWKSVVLEGDMVSNHPPLFTLLATLWRALGLGETEWSMRMLTVTLGVLSILTIYLAARRLLDERTALIAAFLVAISPLHVLHSQDLKEYMMLPVTTPVAVYFLYRATEENRPRLWFWYGIWAGIACYSDLFAGPLLVSINLWFLLQLRGRFDRIPGWVLGNILGAALFLPQLGIMLAKADNIMVKATAWWVPAPTLVFGQNTVLFYVKSLAFGYWDVKPQFYIALALYVGLAVAGAVLAWRRNWRVGLLLVLWFALSVAQLYAVSQVTQSVFLMRAMIPYGLAFYILAATAVARLKPVPLRAVLVAVLAVLAGFALEQRYTGQYPATEWPHRPGIHPPTDFDLAARYVMDRWKDGDIVISASASTWFSLRWYGIPGPAMHWGAVSRDYIEHEFAGNPLTTGRDEIRTWPVRHVKGTVAGRSRVWFIFSDWERLYYPGNASNLWHWFDAHYTEILHQPFRNIEVFLYAQDADGKPLREVARVQDDGATAEVVHALGGDTQPYAKVDPDRGLVARPAEERRGDLLLRFDEKPAPEVRDLTKGREGRLVTFSLANRSDEPAQCRVDFLASDGLIELPALFETGPEPGHWNLTDFHNPQAPPPAFDFAAAVARLAGEPTPHLEGTIRLPAGTYETTALMLGRPGDPATGRAPVILVAGDTEVLRPGAVEPGPLRWNWITGNTLTVPEGAPELPVRLLALPLPTAAESWADAAYLALRRLPAGAVPPSPGKVALLWPGTVSVPPGGELRWSARVANETGRVDVWVYEDGEGGQSYRIYRAFDASALLRPQMPLPPR